MWTAHPVYSPSPIAETGSYPRNASSCDQCHAVPAKFGSSRLTVFRAGRRTGGTFVPGPEGGIQHRQGSSFALPVTADRIDGERVSLSLLGDGYIEAIDDRDLQRNAAEQRRAGVGIAGAIVLAPVFESNSPKPKMQVGRFGWKSQHSSLMSACAESLRNELGIRNRLYPDEYRTNNASAGRAAPAPTPPAPFDKPDLESGKTELERLLDDIRRTAPPARDEQLAASPDAQSGEKLFARIGCAYCHVTTYKTLPPGTLINGGTYRIPDFVGNRVIHPYSDFLLHDVGTGDASHKRRSRNTSINPRPPNSARPPCGACASAPG